MFVIDKIKKHLEQKKQVKHQKEQVEEIKINFRAFIRELEIINKLGNKPERVEISFFEYGYKLGFYISRICDFSRLENNKNFIRDCFNAYSINLENNRGYITLTVYKKPLEEKKYKKILLSPYCLLLGYNYESETVITDMRISPHLLISGLSGQGKTGQIRVITANLSGLADIYLINCFLSDFRGFNGAKFVNGDENILSFLQTLKQTEFKEHDRPIYLIFDELMTLTENKQIQKLIKEFLCVCRHYNIFIIGILQVARAEDFKSKTFFNSRVSFKQIEKSSYNIALGTIGDMEELKKREFYIKGSEGIEKAFTYTLY